MASYALRNGSANGSAYPPSNVPSQQSLEDEEDMDEFKDPTLYFERGRIQQLKDERVHVQKKTFTKWCNSFLTKARLEIVDLFADVGDGVLLMKLLEIISGDKLGRPNRGRMRVQKIENLNRVLDFLKKKKIKLENIGPEDILDRNERLILGLIWTIILRFQIEDIEIDVGDEEVTGERRRAKDALLLWCQRKTAGYPNVKVENFTGSWRSGMAFNALIHAHRPDLIEYNSLNPQDHIANLNNAFDTAEKKLGIAKLLDAEDVDINRPDEKSIMTYVSMYYHYFAKQKSELTGARRVAKIVGQLLSTDQLMDDYESLSSDILEWIFRKIELLNDRKYPNSLKGIQEEMVRFKQFRTVEKPPKYKEKGELEALFFTIQTKRKAMGRKGYTPPQGLLLKDIESAWEQLEKAEHARQVALAAELIRQERLEQLARKFERKARLRDAWLKEMQSVLLGFDIDASAGAAQVEAAQKKHEAIAADILPREDRFRNLSRMATDLEKEAYHDGERVKARERDILDRWNALLTTLESRKKALLSLNNLMSLLRDIDTLASEFSQLEPIVRNRDVGKHVMGVEDLLQKHKLTEATIGAQGEWLENIAKQCLIYIRKKGENYEVLQKKLDQLQKQYERLQSESAGRRAALLAAKAQFQFVQDHEEEEAWIAEKHRVCRNMLAPRRDLAATPQLHRLYKNVETEMQGHWQRSKVVLGAGERLLTQTTSASNKEELQRRIASLQRRWDELRDIVAVLGRYLNEAQQACNYLQDANEAESWMREKMPLACSDDFGKDATSANSLLSRHTRLEEEIRAYKSDIDRLEELAEQLSKAETLSAGLIHQAHSGSDGLTDESADSSLFDSSAQGDAFADEDAVTTVKMLYSYDGHGISVQKGELIGLIQKTNDDWWRVRTADGSSEGYVPANYVKEIESTSPAKPAVKPRQPPPSSSSLRRGDSEDAEAARNPIAARQQHISATYRKLNHMAQTRHRYLEDAIKLYRFFRECDDFELWATDVDAQLNEQPSVEHVEASRNRFNRLCTEIQATGGTQVKSINTMADELINEDHTQKEHIRRRQAHINKLWAALLAKRQDATKALETAESVAAFNRTCEETRSWMAEKFDLLDEPADAKDEKGLQALQRRHQNLEREMKPLEEKMRYLKELANQVKDAYPSEAAAIDRKLHELEKMWMELKGRTTDRRQMLEETQGQQMFHNAAAHLLAWVERTKVELADDQKAVDVSSAEELLRRHVLLSDELDARDDEFAYVAELGRRLLDRKSPGFDGVKETLSELSTEQRLLRELWMAKEQLLKNQLELQLFDREADQIDAATKGHEHFLDIPDLGNSVEEVDNLLRRHADFETKLTAQDERLADLDGTANRLIRDAHPECSYVDERRTGVLQGRTRVKHSAQDRRAKLNASQQLQQFNRDADEVKEWMSDKLRVAVDESYKDGVNLDRKLKRHEAFEAELNANEERIDQLNKQGSGLIDTDHYAKKDVGITLDDVNRQWKQLLQKASDKGDKLRQACDQKTLNRTLEDANLKLDDMERALASKDLGTDLRGVQRLIQKHQLLEQEMGHYNKRIGNIVSLGQKMAKDGHFDSQRILRSVDQFTKRFESLQEPAARRRAQLEESRKLHQFAFDVDCELQWIAEKQPLAVSTDYGRSLTETTNLHKKHEQLETAVVGHQSQIDSTLVKADELLASKHSASDQIRAKANQLNQAWNELLSSVKDRKRALDLALKGQQYLFDAAEIENWMTEKRSQLNSEEYGSDEDAASKLLTKHKALQADMTAYRSWIENLHKSAAQLEKLSHPDSDLFLGRQKELEEQFDELNRLADRRRQYLDDAVCLYQYLRESQLLETWINEQLQVAMSEDYGQDYEHLLELQQKFNDFKHAVKTGSERFVACEQAAKTLLNRKPPFTAQILNRQEQLRSAWSLLLDYIESREQRLEAAEEIHRFNRDAADALERIQEKSAAISEDDLGRDVNAVQTLLKKHDAFENVLVALEKQLQALLEESGRLKQSYPTNAEHISGQQKALSEAWTDLTEKTLRRRDKLNAAYDLQRFMASARDLIGWTQEAINEMQTEQPVRDLQGAELLHKEHGRLKAEIDAREGDLSNLAETAQQMIQAKHFARQEIADRMTQVEDAREKVFDEWKARDRWLMQLVQWHAFQRDAKQTLAAIQALQTAMQSAELGRSVDEVEGQMRKHETNTRLLEPLQERVDTLDKNAKILINDEKHMESPNIDRLLAEVKREWRRLGDDEQKRRKALHDALLAARFHSDVSEMDGWIEEKSKRLTSEAERQGQLTSLQDKMRRLQKHQAFEAELAANEPRVQQIKLQSSQLQSKQSDPKSNMQERTKALLDRWTLLSGASKAQSRALEDARDLLSFTELVERVLGWIKDKELMITAGDMGRDYEHCQMLLKRLDDVESDGGVDEQTIGRINEVGNRLARQSGGDDTIQTQLDDINKRWRDIQGSLQNYRQKLGAASDVHYFNQEVDDTNQRINQKAALLASEDYGKDLNSVETLLRKQEEVERDMSAIHAKLNQHDADAQTLLAKKPPLEHTIIASLQTLQDNWDALALAAQNRRTKLHKSLRLQQFFDTVRRSEHWAQGVRAQMGAYAPPTSVAEAQMLRDAHADRHAEIAGRQDELTKLRESGQELLTEQPEHKADIGRAHKRLQALEHDVRQNWELENDRLVRYYDLQVFRDQCLVADSWLGAKEAFLNREEVGDSVDNADALLSSHRQFEQTLHAQSDKIQQLQNAGEILMKKNEQNREEVECELETITQRHAGLLKACEQRKRILDDSRQYHLFLRSCYELMGWINAKLQIAYDESYLDSTNLRSKLHRHQAFDAELKANQGRVDATNAEGKKLMDTEHFAKQQIDLQLKEVNKGWSELLSKSALKTDRLCDAYEAHQLTRKLEDLDRWLDQVETELASEDHGKDLPTVADLLKKQDQLDDEIKARQGAIAECERQSADFAARQHFMAAEVAPRASAMRTRYASLAEPCQIRRDNLRDAQALYQWLRDANEAQAWAQQRLPTAASTHLGDNLLAVQSLLKRHQALEHELQCQQPHCDRLRERAALMNDQRHFAAKQITETQTALEHDMDKLKDAAATRGLKLKEALSSQQYYAEATEAEQWIKDRLPPVRSTDLGKDEEGAGILLRKTESIEKELSLFGDEIRRLADCAARMIDSQHHDAARISQQDSKLSTDYEELRQLCHKRKAQLSDAARYYAFVRQADALAGWLKEKHTATASEEYGRDLEDCQTLIDNFDQLVRELASAGERVAAVQRTQEELTRSGHPYSASIRAKWNDLHQLWSEVNEAATERQQALQGAKQVHKFDQDADETLNWLQEKEAMQVVAEQEDLSLADLPAINALLQKHADFKISLTAVEKQVGELCKEAERLEAEFPDTKEHLEVRSLEMDEQLKDVLTAATQREQKLNQAEQLQAYFQEYRTLLAWIQQLQTKLTSEMLPRDVPGCTALWQRHGEYGAEMRARRPQVVEFVALGHRMCADKHLLASEIKEKISNLESAFGLLEEVWKERKALYECNQDAQLWKRDASTLEAWLTEKEGMLGSDWRQAMTVDAVEELIRRYDDFLTTLQAQDDKFEALKKLTLLEQAYGKQRQTELERMRVEEQKRGERQKKDQIKTVEKHKILQERRQERERRKTQEISMLSRPSASTSDYSLGTVPPRRQGSEPRLHQLTTVQPSSDIRPPPPVTRHITGGLTVPHSGAFTNDTGTPTAKRNKSFTTRRRTQSIKKMRQWEDLAQIEIAGYLDRKMLSQSGGKKATIRSWKNYYTILCGQLMCFFKDEDAFMDNMAASPPVYILNAQCEPCVDYTKRRYTFSLKTTDGAEYLLAAESSAKMQEWVAKVGFHASLAPSQQFQSFAQTGDSAPAIAPPPAYPATSPPPFATDTPIKTTTTLAYHDGVAAFDERITKPGVTTVTVGGGGSVQTPDLAPPTRRPPPIPRDEPRPTSLLVVSSALYNGSSQMDDCRWSEYSVTKRSHVVVNGSGEPGVALNYSVGNAVFVSSTRVQTRQNDDDDGSSSVTNGAHGTNGVNGTKHHGDSSSPEQSPPQHGVNGSGRAAAAASKSSTLPMSTATRVDRTSSLKTGADQQDFGVWLENKKPRAESSVDSSSIAPSETDSTKGKKGSRFGSFFKSKKSKDSFK